MNVKKSGKKKYIIISAVIVLIIIAIALYANHSKSKDADYIEETVKVQDISKYNSFTGNIESRSRQDVFASTLLQINSIKVKEGDIVKKGDVLFKDSLGGEITADIDGEVGEILVNEDEICQAGTQLTTITDYDNLRLVVNVDEYDIASLEVGKEVKIYVNSLNKEFNGKVSKVSKEAKKVGSVTYFTATVDLDKNSELRVGMSAEAKILVSSASNVVTIPNKALRFDSYNNPYVYIKNNGVQEKREIKVGINNGTIVEVTEGLAENDIVIIPNTSSSTTTLD